jgi:hypothetical protein
LTLRAIAQNGTTRDSRAATAAPPVTGLLDERQVLLSTLPPSRAQKRLALAIVLMLLAAFCATLPFATPAGYIREFIPAYATAMFVISSITSALLFVQFSVIHSRALLAVSGDYVLTVSPNRSGNVTAHGMVIDRAEGTPRFFNRPKRSAMRIGVSG